MGGGDRCQAIRQSCMQELRPSLHRVVTVTLLGKGEKKKDARIKSDFRSPGPKV